MWRSTSIPASPSTHSLPLQQGELDLVMTSDILPRSGLHYSPMFDFEVRLVLAPEHPLAMKTLVTPEDLAAENAVDLSRAARAPRYLAPLPAAGRHQPAAEKRR
ncbi:LysR family transcriptional regulator [Klebsiella pneumoniae]|nr:LysR family transcriptional regulator [Klebsiella pneumoniae]